MAYHPDTPTPLAAVGARFAGTASTTGCSMRPVTDPNCIRRRSHPCSSLTASHTSSKTRAQHHTQQRTHQSGPHRTYNYGERVGWRWPL